MDPKRVMNDTDKEERKEISKIRAVFGREANVPVSAYEIRIR